MPRMIRPIVKWVHCADHDPLVEWIPDAPEVFETWFQAGAGPIDGPGADDWQLQVASPAWVAQHMKHRDSSLPIAEEGWQGVTLVLSRWDYHRVLRELDTVCRNAAGPNWHAVARRLVPYGLSDYGLPMSYVPLESEAVESPGNQDTDGSLSIEEELRQGQQRHVLESPAVRAALANLPRRDSHYVRFWGLGDPAVQAFWLSIDDELLMRSLLWNMSPEVRYVLNVSDDPHEREMGRVFDDQTFQPFLNEIEARVWRAGEDFWARAQEIWKQMRNEP